MLAGPNVSFEAFLAPYAPPLPPAPAAAVAPVEPTPPQPFTRLSLWQICQLANFAARPDPRTIWTPRSRINFYLLMGSPLVPGRSLFGPSFVVAREFQWCLNTEAQWAVAQTPVADRLPGSRPKPVPLYFRPWGRLRP